MHRPATHRPTMLRSATRHPATHRPVSRLTIGAAAVALALAAAVVPAATARALDNPGDVAVSLVDQSGRTVALAGAAVEVSGPGMPDEFTTTAADGSATVSEPVGVYTVTVTPRYTGSFVSYAPARVTGVQVTDSAETGVPVVMLRGATVSGPVGGPGAAVPVGWRIDAIGRTTGDHVTTTTSAAGRYEFVGLATDTYRIEATPPPAEWPASRQPTPTVWDVAVTAQQGDAPAQHLSLVRHSVHTTYDVDLSVTAAAARSFAGATLTLLADSGATTTATVSDTIGATHLFQAVVPSGDYRLSITLPATATTAAQTLWYSTYFAGDLTPDAVSATSVSVAYPFLAQRSATLPG